MAIFKKDTPKVNLTREIGISGDAVFQGFNDEEARTDNISIETYRRMIDTDTTVEALVNIFKMGILASSYSIKADEEDEDEVQAEFVRSNLLKPSHKGGMKTPMDLFLDQALQSIYEGFALFEKVYEVRDGKYLLSKLAKRDSTTITLVRDADDGFGGAIQRASKGMKEFEVFIPAGKSFLLTYDKGRNFLYGRSALKSLYPRYDKKKRLEYLDSIALQADAIKPKVLMRTAEGIQNDKNNKLSTILGMLSRLGERKSSVALPYGYDLKVLETNGRDPHQSIERQNSEMARAFHASVILTATQGSASNVGSYSLSSNQKDLLNTAITGVMKMMEAHINRFIIADIIDLNFAKRYYPEFKFDTPDSSVVDAVFEAFKIMAQKDRISDEMVRGLEEQTASRLGINIEKQTTETEDDGDDEGGQANFGDKFHLQVLADEFTPSRPLNEWEKHVKFDVIYNFIQSRQDQFAKEAKAELDAIISAYSGDEFVLTKKYQQILAKYFKEAYNFGKLQAADESKEPSPALKAEMEYRINEYVKFISDIQVSDANSIIQNELLKQPVMRGETVYSPEVAAAIAVSLNTWSERAVRGTAGTIISQGFNTGRTDAFNIFDEKAKKENRDIVYEWSALMERNTCAICAALDNKIVTPEVRKNGSNQPQKHFNCRCVWVRIDRSSGGVPEAGGIDTKAIQNIENVVNGRKADVLTDYAKKYGVTKKEVESILAYQSNNYYKELNNSLRRGVDLSPKLQSIADDLDKVFDKMPDSKGVLYRGISLPKKISKSEIKEDGYMSTTSNLEIAKMFGGSGKHNYILEIEIKNGTKVIDVNKVLGDKTLYTDEHEYLLPRGNKYIINSIEPYDDGVSLVKVNLKNKEGKELSEEVQSIPAVQSESLEIDQETIKHIRLKADIDNEYYASQMNEVDD